MASVEARSLRTLIATDDLPCMQARCRSLRTLIATDDLPRMQVPSTARFCRGAEPAYADCH